MAKAKILVVEDERIVALDIKRRLERMGYAVSAPVSCGEEAILRAAETQPDLVLMDIKLKGQMNGVQAARQIRAYFDIPVVYLTAFADGATLEQAKVTEPYGYLLKPFGERELHSTIEMALYKHKVEQKLRESEQWLATTLKSIGDAVMATDAQGHVKFMNPVAEKLTGWPQEEALGQHLMQVFRIKLQEPRNSSANPATKAIQEGVAVGPVNHMLVTRAGTSIPIDDSAAPIVDDEGNVAGVVLVFRDISERLQREQERERLIAELQSALAKVETLNGLLPICAFCKKIRNDQGYWQQVEEYIQNHSEVEFSHSFCPDCAAEHYPDFYEERPAAIKRQQSGAERVAGCHRNSAAQAKSREQGERKTRV